MTKGYTPKINKPTLIQEWDSHTIDTCETFKISPAAAFDKPRRKVRFSTSHHQEYESCWEESELASSWYTSRDYDKFSKLSRSLVSKIASDRQYIDALSCVYTACLATKITPSDQASVLPQEIQVVLGRFIEISYQIMGFESKFCRTMGGRREYVRAAVLDTQTICRLSGMDWNESMERVRDVSCRMSQVSRVFAFEFANAHQGGHHPSNSDPFK